MKYIPRSLLLFLLLTGVPLSLAQVIEVDLTFHLRDTWSASPFGFPTDSLTFGINVRPNPNSHPAPDIGPLTTVTGTQGGTTVTLFKVNSVIGFLRDQYSITIPYDPGLTGSWELEILNPGASNSPFSVSTLPIDNTPSLPLVTDMKITGSGTNLAVSWTPPGVEFDIVSIFIWELNSFEIVHAEGRSVDNTDPYQIPTQFSSGRPLELGINYSMAIQLIVTRDGTPSGELIAASRSFFNFTPTEQALDAYLPTVGPDGIYRFDIGVETAGEVIFIDPPVAVGYDYAVGDGDPKFASVLLPDIGDGLYNLWLFKNNVPFHSRIVLEQGEEFSFDSLKHYLPFKTLKAIGAFDRRGNFLGVDHFRILGIEQSAALDPVDVTAFQTGLSFASTGRFTGTMTPITVDGSGALGIAIDIKPGSKLNCTHMNGRGVVPVAIFGANNFDVTGIDVNSLRFNGLHPKSHGGQAPRCALDFANKDQYLDLVCHFIDDLRAWIPAGEQATVRGALLDGTPIKGSDTICLAPKEKRKKGRSHHYWRHD